LLALTVVAALARVGFFERRRWEYAHTNAADFIGSMFPPDFSAAWSQVLGRALVETVLMAYAGTLLGLLVALPLAVLATRPITGWAVSHAARVLLAFLRSIPSLLWALLFVVMVGLGPVPGVLGLAAYTVGYLGKLYYETFEGVDAEVLEAVRATGAGRIQLARHVVLPEAANPVLSQLLFIFEYNVRASSILGLVGAGGIGFPLFNAFNDFQYDKVASAVFFIFVLVVIIDLASGFLRRRFLATPGGGAAG
jgi:phosphonate transport system permease protein